MLGESAFALFVYCVLSREAYVLVRFARSLYGIYQHVAAPLTGVAGSSAPSPAAEVAAGAPAWLRRDILRWLCPGLRGASKSFHTTSFSPHHLGHD
jgi:hypothetical protein